MRMNRACSIALLAGIGAHVAVADVISIDVRNNFFQVISAVPGQGTNGCTINVGDTVTWTWLASLHSVTVDDGSYDSGVHNTPFAFSHTFHSSGTYGYHCIVRGAPGQGMFGTVTVIVPCPADFNGDGRANSQDFFDFLTAFFAAAPAADFNHDAVINSQDFFDFLTAFFAGC
jgi:plastocyanin